MRSLRHPVLAAVLLFALAAPASAVTLFTASLDGLQEAPPVVTAATGSFELTLNDAQDGYSFVLTLNTFSNAILMGHIHQGAVGVNGAVLDGLFDFTGLGVDITGDDIVISGTGDTASVLSGLVDLINGEPSALYVNVHTGPHPLGEIRGQLQLVPEPATTLLFGTGLLGLAGLGRRRAT